MTGYAFISYARVDADFAKRLGVQLREAGVDVWLDQLDIAGGERWDRAVERALKNCSTLIVILTPTSVGSENVMDEVGYALQKGIRVIPVLHQPCEIPLRLQRVQYLDFTRDYDSAFTRLISLFRAPAPDTTADPPPVPVGRRRPTAAIVALVAIALIAGAFALYKFTGQRLNRSGGRTDNASAARPAPPATDPSPAKPEDGRKSLSVFVLTLPGVDAAIQSLRAAGYAARRYGFDERSPETFQVISVGSGVPARNAQEVIAIVRRHLPGLSYVVISEDRPDVRRGGGRIGDRDVRLEITVGATNRILDDFPNIRPLTGDEFKRLTDAQNDDTFRNLVRTHYSVK